MRKLKLKLLADELENLKEENQRLLIENDFLRSKCVQIEQEVTERMLKEELIRLEAQAKTVGGICEITGNECSYGLNCENCPERINWPWK